MAIFILGLITFFAPHLFTPFMRGPREALIERLGAGGYKGAYSIVSAIGLALIVVGWRGADRTVLYVANYYVVYLAYALTFVAFILLAAAQAPKGKIAAAVKHPMLAGVKLWAFAHLLVNGDVRSALLFGSFLAYGVIDRIMVKRRGAHTGALTPARSDRVVGPIVNDVAAIVAGGAIWAAIYFYFHKYIAGVALT